MLSLTKLISVEVLLFLGALFVVVATQLLTGGINTRNLFYGTRGDGSKYFSPERVQLLIFTIAIALQYLNDMAHSGSGKLPPISETWIALLGGSHAVYLGRKAYSMLQKPKTSA